MGKYYCKECGEECMSDEAYQQHMSMHYIQYLAHVLQGIKDILEHIDLEISEMRNIITQLSESKRESDYII